MPFPPLQNPASYNLDQVMEELKEMKASVTQASERSNLPDTDDAGALAKDARFNIQRLSARD